MILSNFIRIKSDSQQLKQSPSGVFKGLVAILFDRENRYLYSVGNASNNLFVFGLRLRLEPFGGTLTMGSKMEYRHVLDY